MPYRFPANPPEEALAWFRAKGYQVGFDHRDVWQAEHATAFTAAKAMEVDLLEDIRGEVDRALAEGRTFEQFQRDLKPRLQERGWWGRKEMTDPATGETREVQLGSPRRLNTIYRTNLRTARAAGQWHRVQRTKASHPYLLYQLGPSENHREQHVAWSGRVLPVDDPWWQSHYPPNGWGCKCRVRQVSQREAERLGGPHQAPPVETREWVNKRTGEVERVPRGIDPGWDYNPGAASRQAKGLDILTRKLDTAAAPVGGAAIRDLVGGPGFRAWYKRPEGDFPVALLPDGDAKAIGAEVRTVQMSKDTAVKQVDNHPELTAEEYARVQDAIDRGERIQDGAQSLVYLLEADGYVAVVKATRTGKNLFLTSFRRLSSGQVSVRDALRRLRRKGK